MFLPEPRPLGDPVDSDPTPPWSPQPKLWETSEKVQVTPDTVTTLAFITEEPTVWSVRSLATHTRTLTVSQDTIKGRKSSPKDVGRGGGYYTHPYDPFISLGGEGDVEWTFLTCRTSKPFISPNSTDNDQPRKVNLTPLCMNNSGTLRKENSVCPHAGVHRTCLTINGIDHRRERFLTPSHQGVDGAVACRPRSISWHVQVPKDSTNWPARECDVTMFNHGSRSKGSTDHPLKSSPNNLGILADPRSLLNARYRGPHPPTHVP